MIINLIEIENNSILSAGSVYANNVKPCEIVGGIPDKNIRMSFAENEIEFLKK
jgi:acetyltransferase-like isoleucine patch superfamily enzyme